jgi:hypothetical protein
MHLDFAFVSTAGFEAMALETVWMTRLHIHYAISLFLKASIAYAISYSFAAAQAHLRRELADVEKELVEIGSHVGAGISRAEFVRNPG